MKQWCFFLALLITSIIGTSASSAATKSEMDANHKVEYLPFIQEILSQAEQGDPDAQANIGFRFLTGKDVAKNDQLAFKWTKLASDQGGVAAQYNLARMYETGDGAAQSYQKAIELYKLASEQGFVGAQRNLGHMYWSGKGTVKDRVQGLTWMNIAAHFKDDENFKRSRKTLEKRLSFSEINSAQQNAQEWVDEYNKYLPLSQ